MKRESVEGAYIGVELANEAREVIVLEELGEDDSGEVGGIPHHKTVVGRPPRHDGVRRRVVHHLIRLAQERGWGTDTENRVSRRICGFLGGGSAPVSYSAVHASLVEPQNITKEPRRD